MISWGPVAWGRGRNGKCFLVSDLGDLLASGALDQARNPRWEQCWVRMNLASNPADTAGRGGWGAVPCLQVQSETRGASPSCTCWLSTATKPCS